MPSRLDLGYVPDYSEEAVYSRLPEERCKLSCTELSWQRGSLANRTICECRPRLGPGAAQFPRYTARLHRLIFWPPLSVRLATSQVREMRVSTMRCKLLPL